MHSDRYHGYGGEVDLWNANAHVRRLGRRSTPTPWADEAMESVWSSRSAAVHPDERRCDTERAHQSIADRIDYHCNVPRWRRTSES